MITEELIKSFHTTGALLDGHFLLTSGRHSNKYFEKFALLSEPDVVKKMCASMAELSWLMKWEKIWIPEEYFQNELRSK